MKLKRILLLALMALTINTSMQSCSGGKFVFVTKYSQPIVDQLNITAEKTSVLYLGIIDAEDKTFAKHEAKYTEVGNLLTDLLAKERSRPKNKAIVYQANTALTLFNKYREEHRAKGTITTSMARVYNSYMRTAYNAWKTSERSLNK